MRNTRSSAERLGRLMVGLAVALGVLVAMPLSAGHRMPWSLSLSIDRAEASVGSGSPFFAPTDLAVEASAALVVVDTHLSAVLRVDPVSGDRTIVADAGTGSGGGLGGLQFPTAIAVEATGTLVVMGTCCGFELFDSYMLRVDPASGDRTTISGLGIGSGPPFSVPSDVAVEASGALVVVDAGLRVLRVEPVSGDRTVVSSPEIGQGPALVGPSGIAVEASGALVVVDRGLQAVLRVDPVSGDRTGVSHATIGSGPAFVTPFSLAVEASGALALVDDGLDAVLRVDPISGDRTVISQATTGSGPALERPQNIAVEATGTLVVVDAGTTTRLGRVLRVDPASGDRAVLSNVPGGSRTPDGLRGLTVEPTGSLVLGQNVALACRVGCTYRGRLVRVDPASGARSVVSGPLVGSGPFLNIPFGLAVEASGALVVVDRGLQAVLRVDPRSGTRTGVSHATIGSGPAFSDPWDLAVEASGTLVVVDIGLGAVLRVDPASGDRAGLSHATVGSGPAFDLPVGIAVEASGTLVVSDREEVLRVDPVSGDRTVVSGIGIGRGPLFNSLQDIAVEASGALVVVDTWLGAVVRVDPVTGDRTVVSR